MSDNELMVHVHANGGVSGGGETAQYMAQSVTVDFDRRSIFIHRDPVSVEVRCDDGKHYEVNIMRSFA